MTIVLGSIPSPRTANPVPASFRLPIKDVYPLKPADLAGTEMALDLDGLVHLFAGRDNDCIAYNWISVAVLIKFCGLGVQG